MPDMRTKKHKTTFFACTYVGRYRYREGYGEEYIIHYSADSIMYVLMTN